MAEGVGLPLYVSLPLVVGLVMMSGLFSGLTLGLLGLDLTGLEIVKKGGDAYMSECADKIIPVRSKGNLLLCTLLLGNVAVNSALSILLAEVASGAAGFFVSTGLIVIFGEIIPQASCSRYALQIGARTACLVKGMMYSPMYLLTKPLSAILDWVLGEEVGTSYSRKELIELMKMQKPHSVQKAEPVHSLGDEEKNTGEAIALGALEYVDKEVHSIMTPIEKCYMLPTERKLDYESVMDIFENGHSRIPVYYGTELDKDRPKIEHLLLAKDLMLADPEDEVKVGDYVEIFKRKPEKFKRTTRLKEALECFKKGQTHVGMVTADHDAEEYLGLVTLEDIVEEILKDEILDETEVGVKKLMGEAPLEFLDQRLAKKTPKDLSRREVKPLVEFINQEVLKDKPELLTDNQVNHIVCRTKWQIQRRVSALGTKASEGDFIIKQGQPLDRCCIILQGECIEITDGVTAAEPETAVTEGGSLRYFVFAKEALFQQGFCSKCDVAIKSKSVRLLWITRGQIREEKARLKRKSNVSAPGFLLNNQGMEPLLKSKTLGAALLHEEDFP